MKNNQDINPANYTAHLHPGKFEGEPNGATEYFYEQMLNGDGDAIFNEDDEIATMFHIWSDEADAFNLPISHYYVIWEDSNGFVYGKTFPTRSEATSAFSAYNNL